MGMGMGNCNFCKAFYHFHWGFRQFKCEVADTPFWQPQLFCFPNKFVAIILYNYSGCDNFCCPYFHFGSCKSEITPMMRRWIRSMPRCVARKSAEAEIWGTLQPELEECPSLEHIDFQRLLCECLFWLFPQHFKISFMTFPDSSRSSILCLVILLVGNCEVRFPHGLKSLTFGLCFNQSMDYVELPASLEFLIFGESFNQSLEHLILPDGLQSLTFSEAFDQSLEYVKLPTGLQQLTFGANFSKSLRKTILPSSLQSLTFENPCSENFENIFLPPGLQRLSLGYLFNQKLRKINVPKLKTLIVGEAFNETLEDLPPALENLYLGH